MYDAYTIPDSHISEHNFDNYRDLGGMRFPVSRILGLLAAGETPESILKSYPYLEKEDIQESLNYTALLADEQIIEFAT